MSSNLWRRSANGREAQLKTQWNRNTESNYKLFTGSLFNSSRATTLAKWNNQKIKYYGSR